MARLRPAPAAEPNERPECRPPHRADLGFVAPTAVVERSTWPYSLIYAGFVLSAFALSVILTWVYNSTGGSLLLVVLLHATINLPITLLYDDLGGRVTVPVLLYFGLQIVAAIVVVIVAGPAHLSRKRRKQEEGAAEPAVATPGVVKPTPA